MKATIACALLLFGCTHTPAPAPPPESFASFVDAYYAAAFARSPARATRVGLHQTDDRLDDVSRAAYEARIAELKDELARLSRIRATQLSFDDAIDAELLD